MKLLLILAVLFAALILVTVLVERFAKPASEQSMDKISRFLPFLIVISMLLSMAKYQGWI
ncbi:hypothetical protein SIN8267_01507 [Sinobacterium norvegicum]|uniref:Uncharacterized protein n=1 Tax=Sinobacterium norvegicum TaxID=1641715 RepID=A0ABM9ADY7_9GAMM|nr:hypothetical protein [Sinobacterium norvegicum]CAH0991403.1 hypothetical protein SIN8267_01507 [Sinobacterium norvegicum]